jgi:hypothetical protein
LTAAPSPVAAALAAIEASRLGSAQKKALRLLAEGQSYREAAKAAELRSTGTLRRHAARFGLVEAHKTARRALVAHEAEIKTELVIGELRKVAGKGARELLRRLDEEPESIQTRDLTVMVEVSLDKLKAWENWGDEDAGPDRGAKMFELLERLTSGGNRVELKVEPLPDPAGRDSRVIDVTPSPDGHEKSVPRQRDSAVSALEGVEL